MSGPTQAILPGCAQASLSAPRLVTYLSGHDDHVLAGGPPGPRAGRPGRRGRPPGLAGPAPLVVMLHGGFGSGTQAEQD
jgi:poly(3-hydroxybutyrate) depolymerase